MKKVSAIICAYNEEKTIKDVIVSVSKSLIVSEIIVVNDGSTDNSRKIIDELKKEIEIKDIQYKDNKGKGNAMAIGVENAISDIVLFIDADLSNINIHHINQLLTPLLSKEADMILGQATETLINYNINPFQSLTGQRALHKDDLLPIIDKMENSKFSVETLINLYYQSQGKTVKYVMLKNLKHPTKFNKTSTSLAVKEFVLEGHQIALTVFNNYSLLTPIIINKFRKQALKNI
jgi:glycosyltransferase involved in cell wall biosynthesis